MDKSVNHSPITKLLPLQKHHCSGVSEHKTVGWEVAPVFACYQDAKIKSEHRDRELWRVDKKTHYRVLRKVNLPCMCLWSCESLWKLSSFSLYPYPNLPGFAVGRHTEKSLNARIQSNLFKLQLFEQWFSFLIIMFETLKNRITFLSIIFLFGSTLIRFPMNENALCFLSFGSLGSERL